jgi:transposase
VIDWELEARIRRLFRQEKWKVGTIARELGVHHSTVSRALAREGQASTPRERPSMIDPYVPFIRETLERYPRLRASRLYDMVQERGYPGGPDHFRHRIARLRPRPPAEAYLRLRTLAGEQAQVDWADFGSITVGRAVRRLMGFVMVLSWSRWIFLRFFLDQRLANFLRGHVAAFAAVRGAVRVMLYDNLRTAVLERRGDAIRFHPELLALADHYGFEPRPVAPYRGNEKGRVERAISFCRQSFFAARPWRDLDDLNAQADTWCRTRAAARRWPEDGTLTVGQAFEQEKPALRPLPDDPPSTDERVAVRVGKTPYVRFDGNDYSIPHTRVRRTLAVLADLERVRVTDGSEVVATHTRSFSRGETIEDPAHIEPLVREKAQARQSRGLDRLGRAAPACALLLQRLAERGENIGSATVQLLRLLELYGASELETAVREALDREVPHPHAVRQVLDRRRHERGLEPPLAGALPRDPRLREIAVRPHDLDDYDQIDDKDHDDDHDDPGA